MATSLGYDAPREDRAEPRAMPAGDPRVTRAEGLWTLFGLTILGAFLVFAVGP